MFMVLYLSVSKIYVHLSHDTSMQLYPDVDVENLPGHHSEQNLQQSQLFQFESLPTPEIMTQFYAIQYSH